MKFFDRKKEILKLREIRPFSGVINRRHVIVENFRYGSELDVETL